MIIKEQIYINTNRDFESEYVNDNNQITYNITFKNKISKKEVEMSGISEYHGMRYFVLDIDVSKLENGFHTFIIKLLNINTGEYDEYENGLGLVEFDEPSILRNNDNDDVFVYEN